VQREIETAMAIATKRRTVGEGEAPETRWGAVRSRLTRPAHHRLVHDLRLAAGSGDRERIASVLRPDVSVVVDRGDGQHQTIRVVKGTYDATALLVHGLGDQAGRTVVEHSINGQAGLVTSTDGVPTAAIAVDFVGSLISVVWVRLHPVILRHGTSV
jgi:hypothetical protein